MFRGVNEKMLMPAWAERRIDLRYTSWEELLLGMQCAAREPKSGVVRPTNVGLLMFGATRSGSAPRVRSSVSAMLTGSGCGSTSTG